MNIIIKKKRIKKMYLRVSPKDGSVNISAPIGTPDKIIKEFVESNIKWIQATQAKVLAGKQNAEIPLKTGSTLCLWGKKYSLIVRKANSNAVILKDNNVFIYIRTENVAEVVLEKWLRRKLMERINERAGIWENIVGKKANEYTIRKMTRCWGNCRPAIGKITINFELVYRPVECLDYVLVHELVHFYEIHHNKKFWSLVELYYPNWKNVRALLK